MTRSVIVAAVRTPFGRLGGGLASYEATQLGAIAIKAALERIGLEPTEPEYVIMGQVLQAGAGQIPARQAAVKAGIPMNVPALTVNKVCLSGLDAIALADQLIRAGEFDIIVAGGQESMTNAPHLLPKSREGYKYGAVQVLDAMAHDGLTDAFENIAMGESTEKHNTRLGIQRAHQDAGTAVRVGHADIHIGGIIRLAPWVDARGFLRITEDGIRRRGNLRVLSTTAGTHVEFGRDAVPDTRLGQSGARARWRSPHHVR